MLSNIYWVKTTLSQYFFFKNIYKIYSKLSFKRLLSQVFIFLFYSILNKEFKYFINFFRQSSHLIYSLLTLITIIGDLAFLFVLSINSALH